MVFVHPKLVNLINLSTTIKMTSFPCHSERHVLMKSIEIFSYGFNQISKDLYNLNFLLCINFVFNISHKCVCNVLYPLSFNKCFYL
jgi:hypothetical protein